MNKNRLEAFSDGVLAIIITIMVLELKIPKSPDWSELKELIPVFFSYTISFLFIGIYWGNHHHLLHAVKRINSGIMWANINFLFWLSLIPFATGWMGENHFARNPVIIYALLLFISGMAFFILQQIIAKSHDFDFVMQEAMRKAEKKGIISLIAYAIAIALSFYNPKISGIIFLVVAIVWIIPEKNIEKALNEKL